MSPADGAGLFCGIIKHLIGKAQECPKVLLATHFYDVFHEPLLDPMSLPIRFLHMEVVITDNTGNTTIQSDMDATPQLSRQSSISRNSDASQSGQQITYLYRYARKRLSGYLDPISFFHAELRMGL